MSGKGILGQVRFISLYPQVGSEITENIWYHVSAVTYVLWKPIFIDLNKPFFLLRVHSTQRISLMQDFPRVYE